VQVPIYRLHDTTGDDLGLLEHPAPNLEPGDVVVADGREALVTVRVEAEPGPGPLVAMLEVVVTSERVRPL
jgi:urease accessory protein UreE